MHKTDAGEKMKTLKRDARELEKEVKALARTKQMGPARRVRQEEADRLKAEAEALKDKARLEDLNIWQMEKEKATKKGSRTYTYWMASWREGGKARNVHLGSCRKMDAEAARQKAQKLKAEALGIHLPD
jgi:regulator of replication initiation timing